MISFEEIKKYLPTYLSAESQSILFSEIKNFPDNIDQRMYSRTLTNNDEIFQGDGITNLLVVNIPDLVAKPTPSIILSNSCDINMNNLKYFKPHILYAPIFQLEKYKKAIFKEWVELGKCKSEEINAHIDNLKKQYIVSILFLPKGLNLENDSVVFLDRICNSSVKHFHLSSSDKKKIFTLSDYGFYMFLIKLSIFFTRIRENIERPS